MNTEQPGPEAEIDLRAYLDVIVRRWWMIAAVAAAALAVALVVSLAMPPVYQAATTVVVDRAGPRFGTLSDVTGMSQQAIVDTLAEIVKSRAVAERALDRLAVPAHDRPGALGQLQAGLRVQRVRGADIIRIQAEGQTSDVAAARANAIAEGLLSWHLEARRSQAAAGRQFVEGQLAVVDRELRGAEDALARYKTQAGQVSLTEQTALAVNKAAEFEAQRRAIRAERDGVEASLRAARAELARIVDTVPSSFVTSEDPVATELRGQLAKLEIELAALREQYTSRHPQMIAAQARIDEVKARLQQQATRRLSETASLNPLHQDLTGQIIKLEVEGEALRAKEAAIAAAVGRYALDLRSLPPKEVELARLTRDLKVAEETYLLLSQKLQETRIAEASIVGDLRVVDRAIPPEDPVKPRTGLNALLGALLGLMAGVGLVFVVEGLDTTFKSPDEVAALGLPVLATIPLWKNGRGRPQEATLHLITSEHLRSPFAEAFRHLRTNLLYSSPDRPLRTILVTSPGPGEGKGTIAANLAIALAQLGKPVWLLDGDLRRSQLTWTFQPKIALGLTDLLVDGIAVESAIQPTGVENLSFIASGTKPPNPAELLGSRKMRELLEQKHDGAEVIILDGPPVLPVTDAAVLGPVVDGVILVVRPGVTPRDAARRAREHLEAVGARVIGVVVNGLPAKRRDGYYGYYSYYDDGEAKGTRSGARQAVHS